MANEVFISYSRKDFTKVREIKETLDREVGIDCWMDLNGIESGDQFKKVIIAAINRHDTLLFMKTSDSMQSKYTMKELNFAESKGKRIILVELDHSPMTDDFLFDYGDKDNIDWNNSDQREKLIRNLKSWFSKVQSQKATQTNVNPGVPEQEDAETCFRKAEGYYKEGMYTEAVEWYRKAAEQGHAIAQYYLGLMYGNGQGVPQSDTEAAKWYRKAAEQGYVDAQYNLGWMYDNGRGVPQSYEEAVKWYRKAAEQGLAEAQNNLGLMYYNGQGVPQSDTEAVKWFRKAAEQGLADAQYNLGLMYIHGRGVPQSDTEAVKWYRKAAEQGYAKAQNNLGLMYYNGQGVPQSDTEAVKWYRKAAEQGFAMAQYNLGWMYDNGRGVPQSDEEAAKWYRKAAEQGHEDAKKRLKELER